MNPRRWEALALDPALLLWPDGIDRQVREVVLLCSTRGGRLLRLASNYPYELWLDGTFVGDGGLRCAPGEALLDHWDARAAGRIVVRLHYLNRKRVSVYYRCLFDDPFLADLDGGAWECHEDASIRFAAKACSQLPAQNVVTGPPIPGRPLPLRPAKLRRPWHALEAGLQPARFVPISLDAGTTVELPAESAGPFDPVAAPDVALHVRQAPPGVCCTTFDLGQIALHRFEVSTTGPVALVYGELPALPDTWASPSREKVRLADAISAGATAAVPYGTRGCRYVHVVHRKGEPFSLLAWRREYPLRWKELPSVSPVADNILAACRRNLVACVDGGVVDTCWRERAQWVGDLRMSALALRALCDNPEIVRLALRQIATSYDESAAMVQGCWPMKHPGYRGLFMPPFHLAFCLTVLEHAADDPDLLGLAARSLDAWHEKYLRDGLVRNVPGWHFTDWDTLDEATARAQDCAAHAVVNAWYYEARERLGRPSIDLERFDAAFWLPAAGAYGLLEQSGPSPHATAAALGSLPGTKGLDYLLGDCQMGLRMTPYFAYFVAKALGKASPQRARQFIEDFYSPSAARYGTIWEKVDDRASLAHGWSVGVAALLAG
ncbi:MAG TPA: hypothetical protein VEL76_40285 [Gemmataceae bacterium]|nr:hypothetical protein [Gemmataceae bacterium]